MKIDDETELWVLLKMIIECKFGGDMCSLELIGSKPLATTLNRLWAAFSDTRMCTHMQQSGMNWEAWRILDSTRPEWRKVIAWVSLLKKWSDWKEMERQEMLEILAAPFIFLDHDLLELRKISVMS